MQPEARVHEPGVPVREGGDLVPVVLGAGAAGDAGDAGGAGAGDDVVEAAMPSLLLAFTALFLFPQAPVLQVAVGVEERGEAERWRWRERGRHVESFFFLFEASRFLKL